MASRQVDQLVTPLSLPLEGERALLVVIALASRVGGALAALLPDDLRHAVVCVVCACTSAREGRAPAPASVTHARSTSAPDAAPAATQPAVDSAYGVIPGRRVITNNTATFLREPAYPPGVFAVPLPNRPQLLAFDLNSNIAAICGRLEQTPFELPDGNVKYARFRCPGTWHSRDVLFLDALDPARCVDESGASCPPERSYNLRYFRNVMERFGLGEAFALCCGRDEPSIGVSRRRRP